MEEVTKILSRSQWMSFNRARKYFKVYFLSHIIMADGQTVHPSTINPQFSEHRVTGMRFPQEQPTNDDFTLWTNTIRRLTSPTLLLSPPLGKFLCICPEYTSWLTNHNQSQIVHQKDETTFHIYLPILNTVRLRSKNIFQFHHTTNQPPSCNITASVIPHDANTISLHSVNIIKEHTCCRKESFLSKLQKGSSKTL